MPEKLLTRGQVAQACGVALSTVVVWERTGKLMPVGTTGLASVRLFREADVERLRKARKAA